MPFQIVRQDITRMQVDAIVNAANTQLKQGGGVCGAIFAAAGAEAMRAACDQIGGCATGEAVMTPGFGLPAKWVIHTVGPVWRGGQQGEERLLRSCYLNAMRLAEAKGLESIAFPLISSGIYGYPKERALQVALAAIAEHLVDSELQVYLAVFDRKVFQLSDALFQSVKAYVDDHYVEEYQVSESRSRRMLEYEASFPMQADEREIAPAPTRKARTDKPLSLADLLRQKEPEKTFQEKLLELIDQRGMTDPQVYKAANLTRQLFSKIRGARHYQPTKKTAMALALALNLTLREAKDLLARAGHAFSPSSRFDLIVQFCFETSAFNLMDVNAMLFHFQGETL